MSRIRPVLAVATLAVAGIATLTGAAPGGADNDHRAAAPALCTGGHAHGGHDHRDEFASCLTVDASLDAPLAVGGSSRLRIDLTAEQARDATLELGLPPELGLVSGPPGMWEDAPRPDLGTRELRVGVALAAGERRSFEFEITGVTAGPTAVEVRAVATDPASADRAETVLAVDVTGTSGDIAARAINPDATIGDAVVVDGSIETVPLPADLTAVAVPPLNVALTSDDAPLAKADGTESSAVMAAGDELNASLADTSSCISANWGYTSPQGQYVLAGNFRVELWDDDAQSSDDLLAAGTTTPGGFLNLCTSAIDSEGTNAQELYLRFVADNGLWRLRNSPAANQTYTLNTGVVSLTTGVDHSFGNLTPSASLNRVVHIAAAINLFYQWGAGPNGCFDWSDVTCRIITVNWSSTSTTGNYYDVNDNSVYLKAGAADYDHTIIHEAAHSVMDDVYNESYPAVPNCNPHSVGVESSQGCAWTEGFAEWVPAAVLNDTDFVNGIGVHWNLELAGWYDFGPTGDDVEGRVAGAMLDISDFAAPPGDYWDSHSEGDPSFQWQTFQNFELAGNGVRPATYAEYWADRGQLGYNVSDAGANAANYQNTIDYNTFGDPLSPYAAKVRPKPMQAHRYSIANSGAQVGTNWAVVAIKPTAGSDYDMSYRELEVGGPTLALSSTPGNAIEVLAADFNHRAAGPDWVMAYATANGGEGEYKVQYAAGNQTATPGQHVLNMSSNFVAVRDLLVGLSPVYVRAVPAAGQDVELLLMDSVPSIATSFVQHRGQAVRAVDANGAGGAEAFSHVGTVDQAGLVVLNKGTTGGSVGLYVDTTAPTGWMNIDGNAYITPDTSVVLSIGATDTDTGIMDMRVAVDGTLDTEPWESFVTSKAVTLPAGQGTKTVRVQFRNRAGMTSPVYTDTIELYDGPLCENQIPTHVGTSGNDTIVGTSGNDVILALGGNDVINAGGGNDTICAGTGNDTIQPGPGSDLVFGDAGFDRVSYASSATAVTVDFGTMITSGEGSDALHTVEAATGSALADTLLGSAGNDEFAGGGGNDTIDGRDGTDVLRGGAGNDTITGGAGTGDRCIGGSGTDVNGGGCEQVTGIP